MSGMQDFYKVLKIHRNATQNEIKDAYRKLAFTLHPDRHDGEPCQIKTNQFKKATEAYQILSDISKRRSHDRKLDNTINNNHGRRPPPPNYRKVYAPHAPPPGFKTFNAKYHYDMHYGDGMMKEEIERARKRAEKASGRINSQFGYDYTSPLGKGFEFSSNGGDNTNPYSRTGRQRMNNMNRSASVNASGGGGGGGGFEYEEGYMDLANSSFMSAKANIRGREMVSERMRERRKFRRRNRGDPQNDNNVDDSACAIM
jgi:curved DNA-binding protein CbpA